MFSLKYMGEKIMLLAFVLCVYGILCLNHAINDIFLPN